MCPALGVCLICSTFGFTRHETDLEVCFFDVLVYPGVGCFEYCLLGHFKVSFLVVGGEVTKGGKREPRGLKTTEHVMVALWHVC